MNTIKLDELLSSKIYVKENASVNFKSPRHYLQPFLDIIGPDVIDYRVDVTSPVMNQDEGGAMNIAYPRINVEATVGNQMTGFYSVIGFIFALDTQIPIAKVYTGQSVRTCLNLTIFNADDVFEQNLLGNSQEIYTRALTFKNNKIRQIEEYSKIYKSMTENMLTRKSLNELLGKLLLRGGRSKLGTSPVVGASKLLTDNKSVYYTEKSGEFECSEWNVYNSVTQSLTDSADPILKPNKTIELAAIIREN